MLIAWFVKPSLLILALILECPLLFAETISLPELVKRAKNYWQKIAPEEHGVDFHEAWFRDGAGATDQPSLRDYARVILVAESTLPTPPQLKLVIRFRPDAAAPELVLAEIVREGEQVKTFRFSSASHGVIYLKKPYSQSYEAWQSALGNRLSSLGPRLNESIGAVTFTSPPEGMPIFLLEMIQRDEVESVESIEEKYFLPAEFAQPRKLNLLDTTPVDLENLRTITSPPALLRAGKTLERPSLTCASKTGAVGFGALGRNPSGNQ